jgi:coenzyme F420-0:L-glutamate ligase / coenzyme F420-1:gamma-L-glutamate ligase
VRVGPGDWFALGHVEAVRAALGVAAGSAQSEDVGIRSVQPGEPIAVRVGRVVALALLDVPEGSADVGVDAATDTAEVTLGAADDYELGRLVVRCQVAAAAEGLTATLVGRAATTVTVTLG